MLTTEKNALYEKVMNVEMQKTKDEGERVRLEMNEQTTINQLKGRVY